MKLIKIYSNTLEANKNYIFTKQLKNAKGIIVRYEVGGSDDNTDVVDNRRLFERIVINGKKGDMIDASSLDLYLVNDLLAGKEVVQNSGERVDLFIDLGNIIDDELTFNLTTNLSAIQLSGTGNLSFLSGSKIEIFMLETDDSNVEEYKSVIGRTLTNTDIYSNFNKSYVKNAYYYSKSDETLNEYQDIKIVDENNNILFEDFTDLQNINNIIFNSNGANYSIMRLAKYNDINKTGIQYRVDSLSSNKGVRLIEVGIK